MDSIDTSRTAKWGASLTVDVLRGYISDDYADELAALREDKARLDHLENLIRQCPHAEFDFSDDPDEDKLQGFSICVDGCDPSEVTGRTFREALDEDRKLTAHRNSE